MAHWLKIAVRTKKKHYCKIGHNCFYQKLTKEEILLGQEAIHIFFLFFNMQLENLDTGRSFSMVPPPHQSFIFGVAVYRRYSEKKGTC